MAESLNIVLNGADRTVPELSAGATVAQLVAALGFRADRVALECNGEIVPRAAWQETTLGAGDRIELVHFVGGGSGPAKIRSATQREFFQ